MPQKQKKTIKEEFRKFMKRELLAITPYDEEKILEFIKKTIQRFIEETNPKKKSLNSGNFRWIDYYNEFVDELHQKQAKWLKENL